MKYEMTVLVNCKNITMNVEIRCCDRRDCLSRSLYPVRLRDARNVELSLA